jgi:DinB superfamily
MEQDYLLKYPIGRSPFPNDFDFSEVKKNIQDISDLPAQVSQVLKSVSPSKLGKTYRENGWTGLQVLHHIVDSHINGFCRLKLALTETNPTIKPYEEQEWSELVDYDEKMIEPSIALLHALHVKWAYLMKSLTEENWSRTFYHPGNKQITTLFQHVAIYSWHGRHHLEHIRIAIKK